MKLPWSRKSAKTDAIDNRFVEDARQAGEALERAREIRMASTKALEDILGEQLTDSMRRRD